MYLKRLNSSPFNSFLYAIHFTGNNSNIIVVLAITVIQAGKKCWVGTKICQELSLLFQNSLSISFCLKSNGNKSEQSFCGTELKNGFEKSKHFTTY